MWQGQGVSSPKAGTCPECQRAGRSNQVDEVVAERAVAAVLNARRVFDEDYPDDTATLNAMSELLVGVDALCRVVVGEDKYKAARAKYKELMERDDDDKPS